MIHRLPSLLLYSLLAVASLSASSAEEIFGLTTGGNLIRFDSESPGTITSAVSIGGLSAGEVLVGIDFRTNTGQLYGVSNASHVYTINVANGMATVRNETAFSPALNGTHFAVDFNPTVDRLRCVSDTEQNLRLDPNSGNVTATDLVLNYSTLDPAFGGAAHVVALAYTNSFVATTSTTLYGIDSTRDTLVTVGSLNSTVSPNGGVVFTVGRLGVDTLDFAGLDISGQTGVAYAALTPVGASASKLYTINLSTGTATPIGSIEAGQIIADIAVAPAPTPFDFVVLRTSSALARFRAETPSLASVAVPVTGLASPGDTLLAIRYRPATGVLYALSSSYQIYTVDPFTGAATVLNPAAPPLALTSSNADFAIDPINDQIRIITDTDQNMVVSPVSGLLLTNDTALAYAGNDANAGADPNIRAIAFARPSGLPLFGIDATLNKLVRMDVPANGTLRSVGAGLGFSAGALPSMDVTADGTIFAVLGNSLYTVDFITGSATSQPNGALAASNVRSLAAVPPETQTVQFEAANYKVIETNGIYITVTRTGIPSGVVTVDYTLTPSNATAATNVDAMAGTLTFSAGETSRAFYVPTFENNQRALFQTASLALSNPIGADLGTQGTATLSIADVADIDGDGFPNDVEAAAGTLPNDPASTPLNNAPAPAPGLLTVSKLSVKLNFAKPTLNDSLSFGGSFANTLVPSQGTRFLVQLGDVNGKGGVVQLFVFDSKGKAKGLTLSKPVKGVSKFAVTLTKSNLIGALAGAGLVNQDLTAVTRPIPCTIYYDDKIFVCPKNVTYTAKTGKAGIATLKK